MLEMICNTVLALAMLAGIPVLLRNQDLPRVVRYLVALAFFLVSMSMFIDVSRIIDSV